MASTLTAFPVSHLNKPFTVYEPADNLEEVRNTTALIPLAPAPLWFLSIADDLTPLISIAKNPDSLLAESEDVHMKAIICASETRSTLTDKPEISSKVVDVVDSPVTEAFWTSQQESFIEELEEDEVENPKLDELLELDSEVLEELLELELSEVLDELLEELLEVLEELLEED